MRIVYSTDALVEIFTKQLSLNQYETGVLNTNKIAVNDEILQDYNKILNGNQYYQDWISGLHHQSLISKFGNSDIANNSLVGNGKDLDHYALASYITDQRITSLKVCGPWNQPYIENVHVKKYLSSSHQQSNPYKTLVLDDSTKIGFNIFDKYLSLEANVYIYDQYINEKSCALIDYFAKKCKAGNYIKVFLFKEDENCFSVAKLQQIFKEFSNIKFYRIDASTAAKIHDRFINFGQRIQITFSKGLDQFGPKFSKGKVSSYSNNDSEINFYDVHLGNSYHEIKCFNGGKFTLSKRFI